MNKRLYRSEKDKVIGGVCAGIAEYLNIDPAIVRIIFIIAVITEGFGLMLYIILWIVIPSESNISCNTDENIKKNTKEIKDNIEKVSKGIKKEVTSDTKKK